MVRDNGYVLGSPTSGTKISLSSSTSVTMFYYAAPSCYGKCSSPRRPVCSHSLVCSEKYLLIVEIGPIRDKDL